MLLPLIILFALPSLGAIAGYQASHPNAGMPAGAPGSPSAPAVAGQPADAQPMQPGTTTTDPNTAKAWAGPQDETASYIGATEGMKVVDQCSPLPRREFIVVKGGRAVGRQNIPIVQGQQLGNVLDPASVGDSDATYQEEFKRFLLEGFSGNALEANNALIKGADAAKARIQSYGLVYTGVDPDKLRKAVPATAAKDENAGKGSQIAADVYSYTVGPIVDIVVGAAGAVVGAFV